MRLSKNSLLVEMSVQIETKTQNQQNMLIILITKKPGSIFYSSETYGLVREPKCPEKLTLFRKGVT